MHGKEMAMPDDRRQWIFPYRQFTPYTDYAGTGDNLIQFTPQQITYTAADWHTIPYTTASTQVTFQPLTNVTTAFNTVTFVAQDAQIAFDNFGRAMQGFQQIDFRPSTITPEEADRRLAEARRQQHKHAVMRQRAVKKGRGLLVSLLNDLQKHEYAKHGQFTVASEDGRIFVLRKRGTVHEIGPTGEPIVSHCIHLASSYIKEDSLIALKLMIENDVEEFDRIAISTRLRPQIAMAA